MEAEERHDTVGEDVEKGERSTSLLSKNAQKKALKLARNEELKPIKRRLEKERRRKRREEAKEAGEPFLSQRKKMPPLKQKAIGSSLVIDLGFDALMTEKEIKSMASQLSMSYSCNRLSLRPFSPLILCGEGSIDPLGLLDHSHEEGEVGSNAREGTHASAQCPTDALSRCRLTTAVSPAGESTEQTLNESRLGIRMETVMQASWRRWQDVVKYDKGGLESLYANKDAACGPLVEDKGKIVYLTADAETVLDGIEEGCAYVIGGLVDRNRYKDICATKARRMGVRTARLPITADRLKSSQVMTVNQVVEILIAFNELGDWTPALDRHLPRRKLRSQSDGTSNHTPE